MECCSEELEALLEAHGVIDYFYVGRRVDGERLAGFICGSDKPDVSVTERMQDLVGMIEANKQELIFGILQQKYCGCGEEIDEDDISEIDKLLGLNDEEDEEGIK